MTYTVGGKIQSTDYNTFVGANTSNTSSSINSVWNIGYGNAGYGQTSNLANVSIGTKVTAVQWNNLVSILNKITQHQNNTDSNVTFLSAGNKVADRSNLTSSLTSVYNNRLQAATTGAFANYDQNIALLANGNQSRTGNVSFSVSFGNADQARYFFNAGGYLNLQYQSFTNNLANDRGTSIGTLVQTNFASKNMRANQFDARTGTGGILLTDTTTGAAGYYGITSTPTTKFRVDSGGAVYTGDYFLVDFYNSGASGSNGGNGDKVEINAVVFSSTVGSIDPSDLLDVNFTLRLTVVEPETDDIVNSWGTVTVTSSIGTS